MNYITHTHVCVCVYTQKRTGGTDYGPFPENFLHFPIFLFAEEVSTFFGVVIRDDEIVEANKEFFSVSLSLDAPEIGEGSNVFLQEPYEAIITIVDNDSK